MAEDDKPVGTTDAAVAAQLTSAEGEDRHHHRGRPAQGRGTGRAGGRRRQPPRRLGRRDHHRHRGGDDPVPPLCRLRHRPHPAASLHPRRLRAAAELSAVSAVAAIPQPHPLVGRDPGGRWLGDHRLRALRRRRFHRPRHGRRTAGTSHSVSSSSSWCWRRRGARPARSCPWWQSCSSPMRCSVRTCRRPGRIAATTSRASSGTCSSRWKASSALRSTSRRRSSSCSRSTARSCSIRAPENSSSTSRSP